MDLKKVSFAELFNGKLQYRVPLFQRRYVWTREDHLNRFWGDVQLQRQGSPGGAPGDHFCGSVVLDPANVRVKGITPVLVVDGQQRLTSAQLAMAAIREVAREHGYSSLVESLDPWVRNRGRDVAGDDQLKVLPTHGDLEIFRDCMVRTRQEVLERYREHWTRDGTRVYAGSAAPKVLAAYGFFYRMVYEALDGVPENAREEVIEELFQVIGEQFSIVSISLQRGDDAYTIFSSLNEGGEPLGGADLIRNDVFHRAARAGESGEVLYAELWKPVWEDDWWPGRLTSGRGWTPRIESFFATVISIEERGPLSYARLVDRYRAVARERWRSVRDEVAALARDARQFRELVGGDGQSSLARFGTRMLGVWELATPLPLALALARCLKDDPEELAACLDVIESYVARRSIMGLYSNGYNQLFGSMLREIVEAGVQAIDLGRAFSEETRQGTRLPRDSEIMEALEQGLPGRDMKRVRLVHVLRRLDQTLGQGKAIPLPDDAEVWIEHLMPRSWQAHWSPAPSLGEHEREAAVERLGNLTLVTSKLNQEMSNGPWTDKRQLLNRYGAGQRLTSTALEVADRLGAWDERGIAERTKMLGRAICRTWPWPG